MQEISELYRENGVIREIRDRLIGHESPELSAAFTARREAALKRMDELGDKIESLQIKESRRIGLDAPCPCGSRIKFNKCCGINFKPDDERLKDAQGDGENG